MADIHELSVSYDAGGTTCRAHLAYDRGAGARPGVIVAPEWWGVTDYIRGRARMLAEAGYTALAVDMYGEGKTADNPTDAGALMTGVLGDRAAFEARFDAGLAFLSAHEACDASRRAAIGYCFGGAVALHAARRGIDLAAVVSFHGSLGSMQAPAPGSVKAKVLVCHGAADEFVPDSDVDAFKAEMDAAGADYRFVAYDGALHGFTSPGADENGRKFGLPLAYDANADRASWDAMIALFGEALG